MQEKIIAQAKAEDKILHYIKRDARRESRTLLKELNLSDQELYNKIKEINKSLVKTHNESHLTTMHLPVMFINLVDLLVAKNYFPNRGELFRTALRDLLTSFLGVETIEKLEGRQT